MVASEKLEELLLEYSAGTLSETPSLLVATHLALSPASRKLVRDMEEIAGALLSLGGEPESSSLALDAELLTKPNKIAPDRQSGPGRRPAAPSDLPEPLASYVGRLAEVPWRRKLPGLKEFELPAAADGFDAKLYRIKASRSMPQHTHDGDELTLVLEGGFSDQTGSYRAGDVAIADPSVDHRPYADPDGDCICLAVTRGPLRLTGPLGRVWQGFAGKNDKS